MSKNEIPINQFCLLVGLDSNGEMYVETIFGDADPASTANVAELLFLITSGALSNDIKGHILKQGPPELMRAVIKKWEKLSMAYDDKPLIDPLQVMQHE